MTEPRGDRIEVELDDVDAIDVRIVAGEVSVTAAAGRPRGSVRVEVNVLRGPDAVVEWRDGTLVVVHQPVRSLPTLLSGSLAAEVQVAIVVPEDITARVRTVSASLFAAGLVRESSLTTVSGRLTATGLDGEVDLKTVSGDLEVQGVGGSVRVTTVSGDLTVRGGDPVEVRAKSVSGDLTLDLDEVPDVDCTSVSGDVALRLPANAGADLEVVSVSGRLETTFPDHDLEGGHRRLHGRIGGGGRRITVRTTSGDVTVLRRSAAAAGRGLDR